MVSENRAGFTLRQKKGLGLGRGNWKLQGPGKALFLGQDGHYLHAFILTKSHCAVYLCIVRFSWCLICVHERPTKEIVGSNWTTPQSANVLHPLFGVTAGMAHTRKHWRSAVLRGNGDGTWLLPSRVGCLYRWPTPEKERTRRGCLDLPLAHPHPEQ